MECRNSKTKLLGLFLLTCALGAGSYFCTTLPSLKAQIAGWLGVAFFGLGAVAVPVRALRGGPQVVIDDDGIDDRRLNVGVIRWEDIRSLSIGTVKSSKFLCIEVAEPEKYLRVLPAWKRKLAELNGALGFPPLTISFTGLSPGIDEVWDHLQLRDPDLRQE
ncbi:MAG TPA: STM3941 family protein [Gemmataceae bacterium]|nr:STM3941 family protein [Gemmataceae bacterium]